MTSIAHPVLPGAVPAVGGSGASSLSERLARPSGSKAVRVGLGVAIAAVMAGDVYAVLRSPASEGRGVGSASSASMIEDGSGTASGFASTSGHVATNPFSESAWGASSGLGSAKPVGVFGAGSAPVSAPAASATLPTVPGAPAPVIVLPSVPSSSFPAGAPASTSNDTTGPTVDNEANKNPGNEQPAASPLMQAVTPVLETVETTVPQAAPVTEAVTVVVTEVDQSVPTGEASTVVETEPVKTVTSRLGLG